MAETEVVRGVLKRIDKQQFAVRMADRTYRPRHPEVLVLPELMRRYPLVEGAGVTGQVEPRKGKPKLVSIETLGGLTPEAFDGPHHLVCVGMDMQHVYVHDPHRSDATGENLAIPWLTFYRAWTQAPGMERAALIPRQQLVRRVRVAVETAEVLSEPGDGNAAVGSVAAGDVFEVAAQRDGWGKIGTDRWISLASVMDL